MALTIKAISDHQINSFLEVVARHLLIFLTDLKQLDPSSQLRRNISNKFLLEGKFSNLSL